MLAEIEEKLACHHCGDPCDDAIKKDEHVFCCYGCKAVHELIDGSNLSVFYQETNQENQSYSEIKANRKYAFLTNEDVQKELVTFKEGSLTVVRFFLPGIHCSSCIYLLEHLPRLDQTIIRSEVNFIKREVTLHFNNEKRTLKEVAVLLSQLGYPPDISLESLDKTKRQIKHSSLPAKIAVAGFCFGNLMLMSMPEYLDHNFLLSNDFQRLFGWINLALSIPLVLYSGSEYFVRAWKGLKHGNLNIDVPIALGILTLFLRSSYEIISATGSGYFDSLGGLIFFLLVGKWYQNRTYQALSFERDFSAYFPVSVSCIINGEEFHRPLKDLKKGDVVVLHNQELIPADGILEKGEANIDYSFVTGESQPVLKKVGDKVYAGGRQLGAQIHLELEKDVNNSELTRLWNADAFRKEGQPIKNWVDRISSYFTAAILVIALGTGLYWTVMDPSKVWNAVSAVLIVACPCALALTLPFAYGHAMRVLGRYGLYLKHAEVVEGLSRIQEIVFDKTGTLTSNHTQAIYEGRVLDKEKMVMLKSVLGNSAHPISRIVAKHLPDVEKVPISSFEEVIGKGIFSEVAGIDIKIGSANFVGAHEQATLNSTKTFVSFDGEVYGYFSIQANYRMQIFEQLKRLRRYFRLHVLSGDNDAEKNRLTPYFDVLRFEQKPDQKLSYLKELDAATLMVGDGLNDAGALKQADVGIAVSEDIHQFSPACDAILQASNVVALDKFLSFSKKVIHVVFAAFALSFLYNLVGISFAITGHLTPLVSAILMPLSSVTVVLFVTFSIKGLGSGLGAYK